MRSAASQSVVGDKQRRVPLAWNFSEVQSYLLLCRMGRMKMHVKAMSLLSFSLWVFFTQFPSWVIFSTTDVLVEGKSP